MIEKIIKGIRSPRRSAEYVTSNAMKKAGRKLIYTTYKNPTNPFDEDWDNLIILDACRFDTFSDVNTSLGDLEYRISPASGTLEWLRKTLDSNEYHDTVYVTANPRVNRYENNFHDVIPAWKTHWNEELNVTTPSDLTDLTLQTAKKHQRKRIVTHFMQPHIPFIGEFGREQVGVYDGVTKGRDRALGHEYTANEEPYVLLKRGEISPDIIKEAYQENLEVVLEEVTDLVNKLDGKTIVTSDHGEMFGGRGWPIPRRQYGHPLYTASIALQKVPWLVTGYEERRTITEGEPNNKNDISDEKIQERLKDLGYR